MQTYKLNQKVRCNWCDAQPEGYEGTVIEVCTGKLSGMYVVRLERGTICLDPNDMRPAIPKIHVINMGASNTNEI